MTAIIEPSDAAADQTSGRATPPAPGLARCELDPGGLSARATLAGMEACTRQRRQVEVNDLLLVLHWADLFAALPADPADPDPTEPSDSVPGGEQLVVFGGDGTPRVRDLAVLELGLARAVSPYAARAVIADALDLRHRLPRLWQVTRELSVPVWVARRIAVVTRRLDPTQVADADARIAPVADGLSPGRLLRLTDGVVAKLDAERISQERAAAAKQRYVTATRADEHGLRTVIARVTAGDAVWIDAMINRVADILASHHTDHTHDADHTHDTDHTHNANGPHEAQRARQELRSDALGWLARPADLLRLLTEHRDDPPNPPPTPTTLGAPEQPSSAGSDEPDEPPPPSRAVAIPADVLNRLTPAILRQLRPRAVIYLHLHQTALTTTSATTSPTTPGIARIENIGPVPITELRDLLAHTQITLTPVIDLHDHIAVDNYEFPDQIAERIILTKPTDQFPFATGTGNIHRLDLDHIAAYQHHGPPGQTNTTNGQPLSRTAHRAKTHLNYHVTAISATTTRWQTPHGLHYQVDQTGTHPEHPPGPEPRTRWRK